LQEQAAVGVMRDQFNFDIFWDFREGVKYVTEIRKEPDVLFDEFEGGEIVLREDQWNGIEHTTIS